MRSLSIDFEPSTIPTLDEQQDALKKGLGRVFPWAMSGRLDEGLLLAACLNDYRYDRQVEGVSPARWVWEILEKANAKDRFRDPLLRALDNLPDDHNAFHITTLAYHYAHEGDQAFRDRLRELVDHPVDPPTDVAHEEVLKLDGEDGFLRVAKVLATELESREWDEIWFMRSAVDQLGEDRVKELLEHSDDQDVRRLLEVLVEQARIRKFHDSESMSNQDKYGPIPASRVIAEAGTDLHDSTFFPSSWGAYASEEQLELVFHHLISPGLGPRVIADLLSVFSRRELPRLDDRLFAFCRHEDDNVRHRAFHALEMVRHPNVRTFGIEEIENHHHHRAVKLLIKNFKPGDEERILRSIEPPEDVDHLHWVLMDMIHLLEENPAADASRLAVSSYALTPCTSCRRRAYEQLEARSAVPGWMLEEYKLDSNHFTED